MEAKTTHYLPNPMAKANYFSKYFTYWWLNDLFRKGNKKTLQDSDVYHVLPEDETKRLADLLDRLWNNELTNAQTSNRRPRLRNAFVKFLGWRFALFGVFPLLEEMARLGSPLLIGRLLSFFRPSPFIPGISRIDAYLTAFGLCFLFFVESVLHAPNFFKNTHCGMQLRIAAGTLTYRKALRLSVASIAKTTTGRIVNLLTSDVQKLEEGTAYLHYLWVTPLSVILVVFFAWQELGPSVLPGMVLLLLFAPFNGWIGKLIASIRLKMATFTDERIKGMNEIITGMRVIKLYTWEKLFGMFLAGLRRLEIKAVKRSALLRGISAASYQAIIPVICLVVFTTHVMTGHSLTTEKLFVVLGLFNACRLALTFFFPLAVMNLKVASVSEKRLQEFLLMEECESTLSPNEESIGINGAAVVQLKNVTAFWEKSLNATLTDISLEAKPGELHIIVGPVGSGKSSLLMTLLGELPISKGKMTVLGKTGYAAQHSWLFSGTVRENIVFGQPFDGDKYQRVIEACALQKDLEQFPNGDMTLVGERGVILSGGQKARINLARAVYYNADIYLLDDPLSAVDTHVGRELFNRCILTLLKDKVCLLVTHQLQYLQDATSITCLREGRCIAQGPITELLDLGLDLRSLISLPELDSDSAVEGDDIDVEEMQQKSIVTRKFKSEETAESKSEAEKRSRRTGIVTWGVYFRYWKAGASFPVLALLVLLLLGSQALVMISEWWLAHWADIEEELEYKLSLTSNASTITEDASQTRQRVILIYCFLVIGTLLVALASVLLFLYVTVSASETLHNKMFTSVLHAPIYFFDTNPVGSVLNRFSKDIGQMDDMLPFTFLDYTRLMVMVFAVLVLNVVAMPFLLLLAIPLVGLFLYMRNYYLKSSREIKRIEALNRSPFYSHVSTSLEGLTSIRAYTVEARFIHQYHVYQDDHTAPWFLFLTASRWLGSRLDFMCFVFGTVAVFTPLLLAEVGSKMSAGLVGLSLTYVKLLTGTFQWCVRQSAEVENLMTSAERVMEYSKLEQENQGHQGTLEVPVNWPKYGIITFEGLYYAHHSSMPCVLKNLKLCIRAEEKVGIVGRTGAGKSSLLAALFRMAEPKGLVRIDGIPITDIRLHDLRSRLSVIPQDPVLFSGSLRRNLDPFDQYGDLELWNALNEVQLKQAVTELPDGLDTKLTEGGSNFSVGQRQLVCLARAILKHNKILVIDEATANVDHSTDLLIQETIRTKFQSCTVLTIAHRLNTIMDCDRVLVLHEGQIMEFDEPYLLLQNERSLLSALVDDTSKNEAANLHEIAHQAYIARRESGKESDNDRETSLGDEVPSRLCMPFNSALLKETNGLSSPFITRASSEEKGFFFWETSL